MAENELANKLRKRTDIIDRDEAGLQQEPVKFAVKRNVYAEFSEFSRKEIQAYEAMFNKYDTKKDKFIDQEELQRMMEKLEAPQTFLALKAMIVEIDEDQDGKISFREFLLIFSKAKKGELEGDGLIALTSNIDCIDVDVEGVKGAAGFFESKITELTRNNKFADEIRDEQEERKRQEIESKEKRAAFKAKAALFGTSTDGN